MDKPELIKKIIQKKEFSFLPRKDVEMVLEKFNNENYLDEEKVNLSRDLLRKVYSGFASLKLLNVREKDSEWFLKKHLSTRERLPHYEELYKKLLAEFNSKATIFDLGCGINGFSYKYFPKNFHYRGVEAIGQLVNLQNYHFKTKGIENCHVLNESLFELEKIKKYLNQAKGEKIVFLFKTIDSLEMIKKDYSKKLLLEITPLAKKVVASFAMESMRKRKKFMVNRKWITDFINDNFKITDDFILGGERYLVFSK